MDTKASYKRFIFESYTLNRETASLTLRYSLDEKIHFEEILSFPYFPDNTNSELLQKALFNLHLIAGISYYKTYIPRIIEIRSGILGKKEVVFWNKLYTKGLGQFFYENNIDFHGVVNFPYRENHNTQGVSAPFTAQERILLAFGGGKDSIVSANLLKENGFDFTLFSHGNHPLFESVEKIIGQKRIIIKNTLSPELFRLNESGALQGHIPVTAYNSFLGVLAAALYGFRYIIFSNARDSNEGNLTYLGEEINHQYSKSFEFEKDFSEYLASFITPDILYFSLLRPFYELKIIELFSRYSEYFLTFSSCNKNFKLSNALVGKRWCGECPKCTFVFLLLAAFLSKKTLIEIMGKNLFDDPTHIKTYKALLGVEGTKPFECVGPKEEVIAAFILVGERGEFQETMALRYFNEMVRPQVNNPRDLVAKILTVLGKHAIPVKFQKIIENIDAPGRD